jgi:hypothetical protein
MIMDSAAFSNPAPAVELHLREHASRYFAEFGGCPVHVQQVDQRVRPASRFYRYRLSAGTHQHWVLIKMPPPHASALPAGADKPAGAGYAADRPRMTSTADASIKHLLEYKALVAIHCYFAELADSRFGAIKPLDYLPGHSALLMEELRTPNLSTLFGKNNRFQHPFGGRDLREAFYNAGAWLRHYHALPKETDVKIRNATRADYVNSITGYVKYLGRMLRAEASLQEVGARAVAQAQEVLPEQLPLGLGHGDYAMRNILVSDHSRVTVIDTLGRWRVPIYEDISHFLVKLQANRLQVYSLGYAVSACQCATYETQFLEGYFGGAEIPRAAVRLFLLQALLDHWASQVASHYRATAAGSGSPVRNLRFRLVNSCYRGLLTRYDARWESSSC